MARHLLKDCDAFHVIRFNQRTATERHEAWLTQRDHGVGGSDLSTILGLNKYATPYTLWLEKTGREQHMDISGKWAVVKGNALETALRARFRSLHPEWECYDGTDKSLVSNTHPPMHARLARRDPLRRGARPWRARDQDRERAPRGDRLA